MASNSADAILAGQSFHWFGMNQKALDEIHRVLKPQAKLGIIWNLADRSVSWINSISAMLDPEYEKIGIPRPIPRSLGPLRNHAGFANEGTDDTTYKFSMELNLDELIERYRGTSVISSASDQKRERMLQAIEQEMKTNPDSKDKQKYNYKHVIYIHWFEKI